MMGIHRDTMSIDEDENERDDNSIGEEKYVSGNIGTLVVVQRSYLHQRRWMMNGCKLIRFSQHA